MRNSFKILSLWVFVGYGVWIKRIKRFGINGWICGSYELVLGRFIAEQKILARAAGCPDFLNQLLGILEIRPL